MDRHGEVAMFSYNNPFWQWLAQRLPRPLVYCCALRLMAHAGNDKYGDSFGEELTVIEALKRWYPEERSPDLP